MNIVMLTSSPRKNGTTALLAERFEGGLSKTPTTSGGSTRRF